LRDRIAAPSTSLALINERLDLVQHFLLYRDLREAVTNLLKHTFDSQRIVQKFSLGRGDADDLLSLLRTIRATENVVRVINSAICTIEEQESLSNTRKSLRAVLSRASLEAPGMLAERIALAIDEDALASSQHQDEMESAQVVSMAQAVLSKEGSQADLEAMGQVVRAKGTTGDARDENGDIEDTWIMRTTANSALEKLHSSLHQLREDKANLTSKLRQEMNAPSVTLRWTPGLGHICHIRGTKDVKASMETHSHARNVSTSKSTRSCYVTEWSDLGSKIDAKKLQIRAEEQRVFNDLRQQVILNLVKLRRNAAILDELDVACSSAVLATEQDLVRPILDEGTGHRVIAGRHPTVKLGLEEQGRQFVSNDCFVGDKEHVWLITGPNMAGKSTFLRQNALISVMAQVGLFVPAEYAEIGIVDQIFSRIGSADNLFQDQSTFMVEMLETAAILKQATPRSFVIMDEVGRGTTPEDGIAVGFAALHHLYWKNKCRTLFATHFHALADMTEKWPALGRYCTDVAEESEGSFYYVHKLKEGVNRNSHALKVARLAGIPEEAIAVAAQVLQDMGKLPSQVQEEKPGSGEN
jgi:DNA mismatch repair ATPase MutS